jgi:hypothetical protein
LRGSHCKGADDEGGGGRNDRKKGQSAEDGRKGREDHSGKPPQLDATRPLPVEAGALVGRQPVREDPGARHVLWVLHHPKNV